MRIVSCEDCLHCKEGECWYIDDDNYSCCKYCDEKWNGEGDGKGHCDCYESKEARSSPESSDEYNYY